MKSITTVSLSLILLFAISISKVSAQKPTVKTETFKVYGNCEMCKETIEDALRKKDGIVKKDWSTKTKMITVSFDTTLITLSQIKQKIADVGYDTEEFQAKEETYKSLHKCCQYKRYKRPE